MRQCYHISIIIKFMPNLVTLFAGCHNYANSFAVSGGCRIPTCSIHPPSIIAFRSFFLLKDNLDLDQYRTSFRILFFIIGLFLTWIHWRRRKKERKKEGRNWGGESHSLAEWWWIFRTFREKFAVRQKYLSEKGMERTFNWIKAGERFP